MFDFHDISEYQGNYDMDADGSPAVGIRMSWTGYGSKQSTYDRFAANNYNNAVRTGKVPLLYHFAGGGDPVAEADFFVGACSPLAENDILVLDYELTADMNPPSDPAAWAARFVHRVHDRTGIWPIFYTYYAMLQEYGFSEVLANCGLWVAHYGYGPDEDIPGCPPYIIHQYQGSPLDTDRCYLDLETLKKYAYHAHVQPPPATTTTTTEAPATTTTTTDVPPTPEPTTTTSTTEVPLPPPFTTTASTTATTTQKPDRPTPPLVAFILWLINLIFRRK